MVAGLPQRLACCFCYHFILENKPSLCVYPLPLSPLFSSSHHRIYSPYHGHLRRMRCAEPSCNRVFFWVVIRRRSQHPGALTPRSLSSLTSWLNGLINYTLFLPWLLWQPLLPIPMERVTVALNHGSILNPPQSSATQYYYICLEGLLFVPESVWTSVLQVGPLQASLPPSNNLYLHVDQAAVLVAVRGAGCPVYSCWPVCFALLGRAPIDPQQGYSSHCQSLRRPGHT